MSIADGFKFWIGRTLAEIAIVAAVILLTLAAVVVVEISRGSNRK